MERKGKVRRYSRKGSLQEVATAEGAGAERGDMTWSVNTGTPSETKGWRDARRIFQRTDKPNMCNTSTWMWTVSAQSKLCAKNHVLPGALSLSCCNAFDDHVRNSNTLLSLFAGAFFAWLFRLWERGKSLNNLDFLFKQLIVLMNVVAQNIVIQRRMLLRSAWGCVQERGDLKRSVCGPFRRCLAERGVASCDLRIGLATCHLPQRHRGCNAENCVAKIERFGLCLGCYFAKDGWERVMSSGDVDVELNV